MDTPGKQNRQDHLSKLAGKGEGSRAVERGEGNREEYMRDWRDQVG